MRAQLRIFDDLAGLNRAVAAELIAVAVDRVAQAGCFRWVLSGGSTPRSLFQLLAQSPWREQIDWSRVHVFWGDERAVGPDDPESNYRMAREELLAHVTIPAAQVHRMRGEATDLAAAARDYQREIAADFGVANDGPPPSFDLVLLGMGPDGHTASLFPGTAALEPTTAWVVPNFVPHLAANRLTMTAGLLNRAARAWLLVAGADKAQRLEEILTDRTGRESFPVERIAPHDELVWWIDRAAAANLPAAVRDRERVELPLG